MGILLMRMKSNMTNERTVTQGPVLSGRVCAMLTIQAIWRNNTEINAIDF